jgi:hypothetical protein
MVKDRKYDIIEIYKNILLTYENWVCVTKNKTNFQNIKKYRF